MSAAPQAFTWQFAIEKFERGIAELECEQDALRASIANLFKLQQLSDARHDELLVEREMLLEKASASHPEQWHGEGSAPPLVSAREDRPFSDLASVSDLKAVIEADEATLGRRIADARKLREMNVPPPVPEVLSTPDAGMVPASLWFPAVGPPRAPASPMRLIGHGRFDALTVLTPVSSIFEDEYEDAGDMQFL